MSTASEDWMDDEVDLRALVARLWSGRWWIGGSVVICTLLAAFLAFATTPTYRSTTVLVPASSDRSGMSASLSSALGQLGGLASIAGINVGSGNMETEEALAVLKSREFTEAFIRERRLMPVLFSGKWDAVSGGWKPEVSPPTPAQAYKYFNNGIRSILQDKKTGLVTLHIDWKNREEAAAWANDLVQRLNAEMRARAIAKSDASVGYLEKELNTTSVVATREAINRLIEAQIKQRMVANVTQEYAFRVVDSAMVADSDDPIKPRKFMLLVAGPLVGFVLGIVGALIIGWLRSVAGRER